MKKTVTLTLLFSFLLLLTGCKNKENNGQYIPIKLIGESEWKILDTETGDTVPGAHYKYQPTEIFCDKYAALAPDSLWYYYDIKDPKTRLNHQGFLDAGRFSRHGYAFVVKPESGLSIIDTKMNEVANLPEEIYAALPFSCGLAAVQNQNGMWGFIDHQGKVIIPMEYNRVLPFRKGEQQTVVSRRLGDGIYEASVVDRDGKILYSCQTSGFLQWGNPFDGYLPVVKDKKVVILDPKGEEQWVVGDLGSNREKYIHNVGFRNGDIVFYEGDKCGLKDKAGRVIIKPTYTSMYGCLLGKKYYIARKNHTLSGVVDCNDVVKIPFEWNSLEAINPNRLIGLKKGEAYLIDAAGKRIGNLVIDRYVMSYPPVAVSSSKLNTEAHVLQLLGYTNSNSYMGVRQGMLLGDMSHLIYDNDVVHETDTTIEYKISNRRKLILHFDRNIHKGKRPSGANKYNFDAKVLSVTFEHDLRTHSGASEKIQHMFDSLIMQKGYEQVGNGTFMNPIDQVQVTTSADPGWFRLKVNFEKSNK